jgi:hypothetical protein
VSGLGGKQILMKAAGIKKEPETGVGAKAILKKAAGIDKDKESKPTVAVSNEEKKRNQRVLLRSNQQKSSLEKPKVTLGV